MGMREILKRNRLQQADLAEGIGVTKQAVWMWCTGGGQPTADNLLKARDWLRQYDPTVTADELLDLPEPDAIDCPCATVAPSPDLDL